MNNLKLTIFFFVLFAKTTIAQTNLNGKIYDAKTGEPLTGAAVLVKENAINMNSYCRNEVLAID